MSRRKKEDENDSVYESTDDPIPKKSTRPIKLPRIQERPGRVGRKAQIDTPPIFSENTHREKDIHLPCINGSSWNGRQDLFRAEPINVNREHQAKMEQHAKMMRRYKTVNHQQHTHISSADSSGSDFPERRQLDDGCVGNSGGRYLHHEELNRLFNAERELVLNKKRQAMLELKDRQSKFIKKCSQQAQYHSGRENFNKEKQHNEPLPVDCKKPKAKKNYKKEIKTRSKHVRQVADGILNDERVNESQRTNIFIDLHKVKDSLLNYENAPCPVFLSADLTTSFDKENMHPELEAEPFIQTSHVQKCNILKHLPLPPIIQKTNAVQLPTICKKYLAVQALPSVPDNKLFTYCPVQQTYQDQKNEYQRVTSPATKPNLKMLLPLLEENGQVLYETNYSSTSTEDVSCSDDDSLTDTGYILGIHAHVVTDEELRKELRLDLSFARTPVSKKESKKTAKWSGNEAKKEMKEKNRL